MPDLRKVLSAGDYEASVAQLSRDYSPVEVFHQVALDAARNLPSGLKVGLGMIARRAIPEFHDRAERLDLCRALGLGAAVGTMMAAVAHDISKPFSDYTGFEPLDDGLPPQEYIVEMHQLIKTDFKGIVGEQALQWLESMAESAASNKMIDASSQTWYPIGASQTIGILHVQAYADTDNPL